MLGSSYFYQFIFELSTKSRNGCSIYTVGRKNSFGTMTSLTILLLFECSDNLQKTSLQSIFVMIYSTCAAFDRHDISKIKATVNVSAHAEEVGRRWYCIVGCHTATCAWPRTPFYVKLPDNSFELTWRLL